MISVARFRRENELGYVAQNRSPKTMQEARHIASLLRRHTRSDEALETLRDGQELHRFDIFNDRDYIDMVKIAVRVHFRDEEKISA